MFRGTRIRSARNARRGAGSSARDMARKIDRHGEFVMSLGDRLLDRYTDGGAGVTRDKRKAKAVRVARRRNRGN
jgi:hypothetical protein